MTRATRLLAGTALACCLTGGAAWAAPDDNQETMRERAFEGAQWVMATQAARAVAQVGARAAAGDCPLGQKIRLRQGLEADLNALRNQLSSAQADALPGLRAEADALTDQLTKLDADIRADFPGYAEIANPQPLGFAALRDQLAPDEALIFFLSGGSATYVWAVSDNGSAWHRSPLTARDLTEKIRDLRADLDPTGSARAAAPLTPSSDPEPPAFRADLAYELYAELIEPLRPALSDARHVFVVKDGALSSLPLSILLTSPDPVDDLTQADWLLRDFAFTTLPAVASLHSIRSTPAPRTATTGALQFAGFGDPAFGGETPDPSYQTASRSIDAFFGADGTRLDAIRALAPLPGTARELNRIARMFPPNAARVTLGADATEAAVKSAPLETVSILSFATHGLVTGDISGLGEPALAFTPPPEASALDDGLLTASEASALTLNADWVILSACNTAAGDGTPGAEGLSGLARAFLFAGARALLVSHWPVRDDVAATLTSDTLRQLNEDPALTRSEALRRAMLALIADDSDPTLAHPSAWAPFVVVGEGGALTQGQ